MECFFLCAMHLFLVQNRALADVRVLQFVTSFASFFCVPLEMQILDLMSSEMEFKTKIGYAVFLSKATLFAQRNSFEFLSCCILVSETKSSYSK